MYVVFMLVWYVRTLVALVEFGTPPLQFAAVNQLSLAALVSQSIEADALPATPSSTNRTNTFFIFLSSKKFDQIF
jgi:putative cell wall-binding protein